jgi:PAS domain S-box-containing protein
MGHFTAHRSTGAHIFLLPLPMSASSFTPERTARLCALLAIGGSAAVLAGWFLEIARLTDWLGSGIHMMPNTAVAVLALGGALWFHMRDRASAVMAFGLFAASIGGVTLCEHLFNADFGIDRLLVHTDQWQDATTSPGRMGLPASGMLLLLGGGMVLGTRGIRARRAAAICASVCIGIASLSLIGRLYGAHSLYIIPSISAIAIPTALLLVLISTGLLLGLPDVEPTRTLVANSAAGTMVRRALPMLVLVPLVIGWLRWKGQELGLYDAAFGTAIRTIVEVVLLLGLLWWMANAVTNHERQLLKSETALRTSEQRYQTFIQLSSEGIWRCELTEPLPITVSAREAVDHAYRYGVMAECNDAMARMYGYARGEELVGARLTDLLPRTPENEAYLMAFMEAGYQLLGGESEERDKDGRVVYFSNNLVGVVENGYLVRAWGTQFDITQRRQAEARLNESERRLRLLAENIDQLMWISGDTWLNKRWEEYTGLPAEEIIATEGRAVYHPDEADHWVATVRAHYAKGQPWEEVIRLRSKSGHYGTFLARATPEKDGEGNVVHWFGSHTNITELMEAKQALELANQRKNEFLATLAHELRNPLSPLVAGLQLLEPHNAEEEVLHAMLARQLKHMVRLIDDLMDVNRINRGKLQLHKGPLDLSAALHAAVEACQPAIDREQHHLELQLPTEPMPVFGDGVRLTQVFSNLLNNAVKFTPAGGRIKVLAERHNGHIRVSVQDSGIGLASEHFTTIFELFSQVSKSTGHFQQGLGIGLNLVKRLVEKHDGTVHATSDGPGTGTTFWVELPMHQLDSSDGAPTESNGAAQVSSHGA